MNPNQKPAFITGNTTKPTAVSSNIINRNNQFSVNNRATNQSVKLPKVQTPQTNNQPPIP